MDARISEDPALVNAVNQLTTRRALLKSQAEREEPQGNKQAPPLLLAQISALERQVADERAPTYTRFYAWVKLVRHWTSMRWE